MRLVDRHCGGNADHGQDLLRGRTRTRSREELGMAAKNKTTEEGHANAEVGESIVRLLKK